MLIVIYFISRFTETILPLPFTIKVSIKLKHVLNSKHSILSQTVNPGEKFYGSQQFIILNIYSYGTKYCQVHQAIYNK